MIIFFSIFQYKIEETHAPWRIFKRLIYSVIRVVKLLNKEEVICEPWLNTIINNNILNHGKNIELHIFVQS